MASSTPHNHAPATGEVVPVFRNDCRHFKGEKPCKFKCEWDGCRQFEPFGTRILIIKLGATGDVLRTTPVLRALKQRHPQSHITWLVEPVSLPLLLGNPLVDKLLVPGLDSMAALLAQKFDVLICLDKVELATGLAARVQAKQKLGFGMTEWGTLEALNPEAHFSMALGISDQLKFRINQKPYQQIMLESLGFSYERDEYMLTVDDEARAAAEGWWSGLAAPGPVVGINTGSGPSFAGKAWRIGSIVELSRRIHDEMGHHVMLLGGPHEAERNREIVARSGGRVVDSGCDNSLPAFAARVDLCDVVVSGDTTAMHIAIALRKQVVALFGSTCPQEIDLYDRGTRIVAQVDCSPCYLKHCPIGEVCMDSITVEEVFQAVRRYAPAVACL